MGTANGQMNFKNIATLIAAALIGVAGGTGGSLVLNGEGESKSYLEDRKLITERLKTLDRQQERIIENLNVLSNTIYEIKLQLATNHANRNK